jgi:hypothetical protein
MARIARIVCRTAHHVTRRSNRREHYTVRQTRGGDENCSPYNSGNRGLQFRLGWVTLPIRAVGSSLIISAA